MKLSYSSECYEIISYYWLTRRDDRVLHVYGLPSDIHPLVQRIFGVAKGRGIITAVVQLEIGGCAPDADNLFSEWAAVASPNAKKLSRIDDFRDVSPRLPALIIIDALSAEVAGNKTLLDSIENGLLTIARGTGVELHILLAIPLSPSAL